ncbi:hypothetical protein JW721_00900 [Candidatus Micrarchaeota archaeon]|nr:hypothetical protein [Candidatus Micrarchaeota archaeon]
MSLYKPPKLDFTAKTAIPKRQVLKQTAFPKKDLGLIEKSVRAHKATGGRGMMVGGSALRFYTNPAYTGKLGRNSDIDFAFEEIPSSLEGKLKQEPLIDEIICYFSKVTWDMAMEVKHSGHWVYHIKEELAGEMPDLDDVCMFEKEVGRISVGMKEVAMANTVIIRDGNEQGEVKVADLGFLLATMINKDAITVRRSMRSAYAIASNMGQMDSIAQRYAEVMEGVGISKEEVKETLDDFIWRVKSSVRSIARAFAEKVEEKMGM